MEFPFWLPGRAIIYTGKGSGSSKLEIGRHIVRVKDGILMEHWDVIQDEATEEQSKSDLPMFGDTFGK
jgi:predicted SnoaL-like aldol condensation-catalyzing enzyme